jgi:hypothetical protein
MKKTMILAALSLFSALLAGCSAGRIQERSYLRALAINRESGKELTFAFYAEDRTVTTDGESLTSARNSAGLKNGKEIFTGYTELIIVDGVDCREPLTEMLNSWKVSPSCRVVYSRDGRELLESVGAEKLIGITEQAVKQGIAPECDIITILGELCGYGSAEAAELYPDGTAGRHIIT